MVWSPPASPFPASPTRGLGTERAGLGIFRGFCTERARLGIFRGLGTERARLGTFRGFGTERARLGTFRGFLIFFFKTLKFDSKSPLVIVKLGVDFRKTVLPAQIFNFFFWTPNFTELLNP